MSSILPMLSLGGRRFIQSTSLSTQWKLHLSVTSTHGNRSLPVSSSKWKKLRAEILLRDSHTCSSCGYLSPHPKGRYMIVDHADGDASNNDPSNLRVHCPPCDAIRHCGFSGIHEWLTVSESAMEQVDIVRKTREIFEKTGVIPYPESIDPSLKPVDIGVVELANIMLETPWKFLPKELQRLRGFFTKNSSYLFHKTTLADAQKPIDNLNEAHEAGTLSISYSEEIHKSSQVFLDSWLPSKTLHTQVAWLSVHNPRSAKSEDKSSFQHSLSSEWSKICAEGRSTLSEVDKLAEQFNILSGKWLVFVSPDEVDNLWRQIVESTLAGTIGSSATVSTRKEGHPRHLICVSNADYRSVEEVNRVRDELRQLGVIKRIAYKPDIYTYCGIYNGNSWGIPPSLYVV